MASSNEFKHYVYLNSTNGKYVISQEKTLKGFSRLAGIQDVELAKTFANTHAEQMRKVFASASIEVAETPVAEEIVVEDEEEETKVVSSAKPAVKPVVPPAAAKVAATQTRGTVYVADDDEENA